MKGRGPSSRRPVETTCCPVSTAGWGPEEIIEQYPVTDGRIVPVGRRHRRDKPLRADYVLHAHSTLALTSLPPRDARDLYDAVPELIQHLQAGVDYWQWEAEARFSYVERSVELVSRVPRFAIPPTVDNGSVTWRQVLRWWLDPSGATRKPCRGSRWKPSLIAKWVSAPTGGQAG